jgi:hypothetical protein
MVHRPIQDWSLSIDERKCLVLTILFLIAIELRPEMMDPRELNPASSSLQKETESELGTSWQNPLDSKETKKSISPAMSALTSDYSDIAQLVGRLDKQLETFDKVMNKLQQDVLVQESLRTLWEEQAQSLRQERTAEEHIDFLETTRNKKHDE